MTMLKSYRSTYEITQFTRQIRNNIDIEAIERHGEDPKVNAFKGEEDELSHINELVQKFSANDYNSLGIICKTQQQANKLYETLKEQHTIHLLEAKSVAFGSGIVITTAHLAKGLEFDQVIVPHVNDKNYKTEPDRQMLYVACTRAMHRLNLTYSGRLTNFLN